MKILILGSGADSIGRTGEFSRFAVQGMRFLQARGHQMVLVDQNPVTLAGALGIAGCVYSEPLTLNFIEKIMELERPDGIMHCFGGSLGAHLVIFLDREGILDRYNVSVLGTGAQELKRFMDWEILKKGLRDADVPLLQATVALSADECVRASRDIGFPLILRPSFASEGIGGYLAYNSEEVKQLARLAFNLSPVRELVLERAPADWVQMAVEAINDPSEPGKFHPVGTFEALDGGVSVHPGNSILVAPALTLKGKLLDQALDLTGRIAEVTGICGSFQVRFALSPNSTQLIVLRINPGMNRFSSFLSTLQDIQLGQINAALAINEPFEPACGNSLPEIPWERTGYCAARVPIPFEEFQQRPIPGTTMRTVGAAAFAGRSTEEALGKAVGFIRESGLFRRCREVLHTPDDKGAVFPSPARILDIIDALEEGSEETRRFMGLNPAFLPFLRKLSEKSSDSGAKESLAAAGALASICGPQPGKGSLKILSRQSDGPGSGNAEAPPEPILILGPGPYRVGLGTEIDHAFFLTALAFKERGERLILLNNNPDSVCNDLALFDAICLEAPALETIRAVLEQFRPKSIVHQFCMDLREGLDELLAESGVEVLGTTLERLAGIRDPQALWPKLKSIGVPIFSFKLAPDEIASFAEAEEIGYPVLVRLTDDRFNPPAEVVYNESMLEAFVDSNRNRITEKSPLFIQKFEEGLIAAEVIGLSDGHDAAMVGMLESIEEYGVHMGDCAATFPPLSFGSLHEASARDLLQRVARHFHIVGHIRLEVVARGRNLFVAGIGPCPGHGIPLMEKALDGSVHDLAAGLLLGDRVRDLEIPQRREFATCFVKESILPFYRYPELDPALSPRMRSIGQALGHDRKFGNAFIKAQMAVYPSINLSGKVFLSVRDPDKESILQLSQKLLEMGLSIVSTEGTALFLTNRGIKVDKVHKVSVWRPNVIDLIKNGEIGLVINIPHGGQSKKDELAIRRATIEYSVPFVSTMSGAFAIIQGMEELRNSSTIGPISDAAADKAGPMAL